MTIHINVSLVIHRLFFDEKILDNYIRLRNLNNTFQVVFLDEILDCYNPNQGYLYLISHSIRIQIYNWTILQ